MSILIKGMEMPTSCSRCPMLEGGGIDGLCHAASKWLDDDEHWTWYVYPEGGMDYRKPCNCPLVPVPTHGRLIDADAMQAKWFNLNFDRKISDGTLAYWNYRLSQMPTIIPAEEVEA